MLGFIVLCVTFLTVGAVYAAPNTEGFGVADGFDEDGYWVHYQGNNKLAFEIWGEGFTVEIDNHYSDASSVKWEVFVVDGLAQPARTSTNRIFDMNNMAMQGSYDDEVLMIKVTLTMDEDDVDPLPDETDDEGFNFDDITDWFKDEANHKYLWIAGGSLLFIVFIVLLALPVKKTKSKSKKRSSRKRK